MGQLGMTSMRGKRSFFWMLLSVFLMLCVVGATTNLVSGSTELPSQKATFDHTQSEAMLSAPIRNSSELFSGNQSPSYDAWWYAGAVFPSSQSVQNARTISTTIQVPKNNPLYGDESYYVILSAFDDNGSYDQLGFDAGIGVAGCWYVATSWTTNRGPGTGLNYDYNPAAALITAGDIYTFNITVANLHTYFTVYQSVPNGNPSLFYSYTAPTGGNQLVLNTTYSSAAGIGPDFTDFEEIQSMHFTYGAPEWDFYFYNQYWVATNGTIFTPTWSAWTYNYTGNVPNGTSEDVNLNGVGGVRINNPSASDNAPNIPPAPSGPTSGVTNQLYTYNTSTTDLEGYTIYYVFDWGDSSNTTLGPYQSGTMATASHSWSSPGNYYVFVEAIDTWEGDASGWGGTGNPVVIQNPPPPPPVGCPFVWTWNGSEYVVDNNLLAASMFSKGTDVNDNYVLQQPLGQNPNGTYSLQLSEFENEHDFIDQIQLVAIDHASNVNVGASPDGQILTYMTPNPPVSAITNTGENVKHLLSAIDGAYYEAHNGSSVILNFGELDIRQGAKLVLRADYEKDPVFIQVQDSNGQWTTVARVIPRVNWSTDIIDMSKFLPDARGNLKVRLRFTADLKVDFVGLDTSPQATLNIHKGQLVSAISSFEGDVTAKLLRTDQTYAVLVPSENIQLQFTLPTQTLETRTYVLFVRGHYYTVAP